MICRRFAGLALPGLLLLALGAPASAQMLIKDQKTLSSAAARKLVDACSAYAETKHAALAMAVFDASGNMLEFHAMEGANESSIVTAPLKGKTALRWRRATSDVNKTVSSGQNLAPVWIGDFPMTGGLPIIVDGQVAGAMGVSSGDGETCARTAIEAVLGKAIAAASH